MRLRSDKLIVRSENDDRCIAMCYKAETFNFDGFGLTAEKSELRIIREPDANLARIRCTPDARLMHAKEKLDSSVSPLLFQRAELRRGTWKLG